MHTYKVQVPCQLVGPTLSKTNRPLVFCTSCCMQVKKKTDAASRPLILVFQNTPVQAPSVSELYLCLLGLNGIGVFVIQHRFLVCVLGPRIAVFTGRREYIVPSQSYQDSYKKMHTKFIQCKNINMIPNKYQHYFFSLNIFL